MWRLVFVFVFILLSPLVYAQYDPSLDQVNWYVFIMTSFIARFVGICLLTLIAYLLYIGKMSFSKSVLMAVGLVLIYGAASLWQVTS